MKYWNTIAELEACNLELNIIEAVQLPDFWWFLRRHHYSTGHPYVCPFFMTMLIWWHRLRGHEAYWVCSYPDWMKKGQGYEPAIAVVDYRNGVNTEIPIPPRRWWWVKLEMWGDRQVNRLNEWLWEHFKVMIQREPLGRPIPEQAEDKPSSTNEVLSKWLEQVIQDWDGYWADKPEHRHGKDLASFIGERLVHDFELKQTPGLAQAELKVIKNRDQRL